MKIDVVHTNTSVDFNDVGSGQVFMWEDDFFICTHCDVYDINDNRYNAIRLRDGVFTGFSPFDQVTLCPNAKLTVEL